MLNAEMNTAEKILLASRITEAISKSAEADLTVTVFGVLSEEKLFTAALRNR